MVDEGEQEVPDGDVLAAAGGAGPSSTATAAAAPPPLALDTELWGQRELLEHVVGRWFHCLDELSLIAPVWAVRPREGRAADEALLDLNQHLHPLGWEARLRLDDPFALRLVPRRRGLFGPDARRFWPMWVLTFLSAWFVGVWWQLRLDPEAAWSDPDLLLRAMWAQALPLVAIPALAGWAERAVARRHGMRIGHLIPIPLPLPWTVWPYGLAGVFSIPFQDRLSWPNRRALADVALVTPLVLLGSGFLLAAIGMVLTPAVPAGLDDSPLRLAWPGLLDLVHLVTVGETEAGLRSHWAHPLLLTGHGLLLMGWIRLLPFPGLSGGRLLVALLGPDIGRGQTTRLALVGVVLLVLFGAQAIQPELLVYVPWAVLVMTGLLVLYANGADQREPRVLDLAHPPDDTMRLRLALVTGILLILLLPAGLPIRSVDAWEATVSTTWPDTVEVEPGETAVVRLSLESTGLQAASWKVTGASDDLSGQWGLSLRCTSNGPLVNLSTGCGGDGANLAPGAGVTLRLVADVPDLIDLDGPVDVWLVLEQTTSTTEQAVRLVPTADVLPQAANWSLLSTDHATPHLAVTVALRQQPAAATLELDDPRWRIVDGGTMLRPSASLAEHVVHVAGPAGGLHLLRREARWDLPVLGLLYVPDDGGVVQQWNLSVRDPLAGIAVPVGGWAVTTGDVADGWTWPAGGATRANHSAPVPDWMAEGSELRWEDRAGWRCARNGTVAPSPPTLGEDAYLWSPVAQRRITVPNLTAANLTWRLPAEGALLRCDDRPAAQPTAAWRLEHGPGLVVLDPATGASEIGWNGTALIGPQGWLGDAVGDNGTLELQLRNLEATAIRVDWEPHGQRHLQGAGWSLTGPSSIDGNGTAGWSLTWQRLDPGDALVAWLATDGDRLILHLAAHPAT